MKHNMLQEGGFTMVEMIVTIVIIGILSGLVLFMPKTFLTIARDQEREDDVTSIARRLEQAYSAQDLGTPSYPSTVELTLDMGNRNRTMSRVDPEAYKAPRASSSSVVVATTNTQTNPAGANTPTIAQYVYQPLKSDGTLCTGNPSSANRCVSFTLYYRQEADNVIKTIRSMHLQ